MIDVPAASVALLSSQEKKPRHAVISHVPVLTTQMPDGKQLFSSCKHRNRIAITVTSVWACFSVIRPNKHFTYLCPWDVNINS